MICPQNEKIRKTLLKKLVKLHKWGAEHHTSFDNLPKGFPSHLGKEVKKEAKQLIKEEILLSKPTSYSRQYFLNPRKLKEIEEIIG